MSSEATKVLLAETWSEDIDPTDWWMSEKLDGVRAYWSGSNFYSRQGNLFHVPDFFKAALPKVPLDGEIWCGRGLFQKCISIVKKQANKVVPDDYKFLTYLIFDAPSHGGKYEDRVKWLQTNIPQDDDKCYASVVGVKKCQGLADLKQCLAEVNAAGGEGIMLRKPGSRYENKRSSTLLKVKTFYDEEALVIGHKPGKGNCTGMLGALECQLPNGKRFDVGSGFTMDQRRKPPKKGSVITFKFQELSNAGSPRFPVFLRLRTDLTWDDVLEAAKTKTPISVKQKVVPTTKLSKQHSILFSVIPSRDGKTGKKIARSDDDDEQPSSSSSSLQKPDAREECPYGEKCYRKNPDHLKQYQHPSSTTKSKLTKTTSRTKSSSKSQSKVESEEPASPTTTDNLLVKDKNKGRQFDDDDEDEDDDQQQSTASTTTNKRKRNLEEKSNIKPTRKRVKKS
ncbi:unnamed protein product [Rotaria socialis]|uniref:DNA ligase n=1 Tax=Rotaria socialis TaxID=392032 RepID=A0A817KEH1_9BILA|nr:unnamed protein product [Rotaria socialis]CAF3171183.1 unnamed protein product [Rotaria socialis]CAF3466839.1 unnamed protein product [Rotaria socialis]CAF4114159.1 unnamed protein product [Rotaria socialis]CAF4237879.1 unnamed protein product [Rotaria socialis]